jgi:hypothetical protein
MPQASLLIIKCELEKMIDESLVRKKGNYSKTCELERKLFFLFKIKP